MEPITWVEHEIKVVDFCSALGEDKEAGSELSGGQSEAGVLVMAWRRLWLGTIVGELSSLSQIDYLFNVDNIIYQ